MIVCHDIRKVYGNGGAGTVALKGVSFMIQDGEFVAIMGPSGSGKSTLMHILGCLETASGGTYTLDGQDVLQLDDDALTAIRRDKIGFVFQSFNLLPRATVFRNVMLPLLYDRSVPQGEREARVIQSLHSVALPEDRWQHRPNELSGGQMQRVAIARALVNEPTLLLADEPTGNLDTQTGELVLGTLERLNREKGHTVILITHEREVALHTDRILLIRDGLLVSDEIIKH